MTRTVPLALGLLIGVLLIVGLPFLSDGPTMRANTTTGPLSTREDAIDRVIWTINPSYNPRVIDTRLVHYQDAILALDGALEEGVDPLYMGGLLEPTWIVMITADSLADIPTVTDHVIQTQHGVIYVIDAVTGSVNIMRTFADPSTDVDVRNVRRLPDRYGTLPIPQVAPVPTLPAPALPEPTIAGQPTPTPLGEDVVATVVPNEPLPCPPKVQC